MQNEIYVSTDVEVDGPIPGPYSMLSIGSAAFTIDKGLVDTFSANLDPLPGASTHPETMAWWTQHPQAWEAARRNAEPPVAVICRYVAWLQQLQATPIFVGFPVAFDFMFVYWYLMRFAGESPFARRGLDVRTYAMSILGKPYAACNRSAIPSKWLGEESHTHVALDDAIEQGQIFLRMLRENLHHNSVTKERRESP